MIPVRIQNLLLLAIFVFTSGCYSNSAPRGWHEKPKGMRTNGYGGWVEVYGQGEKKNKNMLCKGELIAVHDEEILCYSETLQVIPRADVVHVKLMGYNSQHPILGGWSFFGGLGTLSNGYFAVFTFPLWVLAGPPATSLQSRYPAIKYNLYDQEKVTGRKIWRWEELRLYARFPQGLPNPQLQTTLVRK